MIHAVAVLAAVVASAAPPTRVDAEFFESKVRPVLAGVCVPLPRAEKGVGRAPARLARGDAPGRRERAGRRDRQARGEPDASGGPARRGR